MRNHTISLLAAIALTAPAVHAQSITTQTGTIYETQSMKSAATFGTDMKGMRITAHFADGQVASGLAWDELDAETGEWGVSSSLFRLSMFGSDNTGSPESYLWKLQNLATTGLTRLVLSGSPGRTVFDAVYDEVRTENSALGIPLAFAPTMIDPWTSEPSPYAATATVTYRNAVALVGSAPLFDLFEEVDLQFGRALAGGAALDFDLDSDTIGEGATIDPVGTPTSAVPEPASVALLGSGLLVLGGAGLRRRRRAA